MCDPILVTLLKMQPHKSQSCRETASPSSGTSPLAFHGQEPSPINPHGTISLSQLCLLNARKLRTEII